MHFEKDWAIFFRIRKNSSVMLKEYIDSKVLEINDCLQAVYNLSQCYFKQKLNN